MILTTLTVRSLALVVICIALVFQAVAQKPTVRNSPRENRADQLRTIEHQRLRSLVDADMATARRLHADDFQLINPNGGSMSKEKYLGNIASQDPRWELQMQNEVP
jgi:hypothetical protein